MSRRGGLASRVQIRRGRAWWCCGTAARGTARYGGARPRPGGAARDARARLGPPGWHTAAGRVQGRRGSARRRGVAGRGSGGFGPRSSLLSTARAKTATTSASLHTAAAPPGAVHRSSSASFASCWTQARPSRRARRRPGTCRSPRPWPTWAWPSQTGRRHRHARWTAALAALRGGRARRAACAAPRCRTRPPAAGFRSWSSRASAPSRRRRRGRRSPWPASASSSSGRWQVFLVPGL